MLETAGRPSVQPFPTPSACDITLPPVSTTLNTTLSTQSDTISNTTSSITSNPITNHTISTIANTTSTAASISARPVVVPSKINSTVYTWQRRAIRQAMLDQTDVFQPVATSPPPGQIPSRADHPAPRLNIVSHKSRNHRSPDL